LQLEWPAIQTFLIRPKASSRKLDLPFSAKDRQPINSGLDQARAPDQEARFCQEPRDRPDGGP